MVPNLPGRPRCSSSDVVQTDRTTQPCTAAGTQGLAWGWALAPHLYFGALVACSGCHHMASKRTRILPECLHSIPPHAQTGWNPALPRSVGILSLTLVQAGFPPMDTQFLPDVCAREHMYVYTSFTVHSTYRKTSSLLNAFLWSHIALNWTLTITDSFLWLGVKEPFLLLRSAITIRLGGRGNEQRSTLCTFQPPAIVKSTLLQTEWQQGTGWEAGVTCQEHQPSRSCSLTQTSTPPSQLPVATKLKEILHSYHSTLESLINTFMANQELIFSCQCFGHSSPKSVPQRRTPFQVRRHGWLGLGCFWVTQTPKLNYGVSLEN